jgi:hypothetical protein
MIYTTAMIDPPKQDWDAYEVRARKTDAAWLRSLTPNERFTLYQDLFGLVCAARHVPGNWERLDRWSWQQKLALRVRLVDAYRKRDQMLHERTAQDDVG